MTLGPNAEGGTWQAQSLLLFDEAGNDGSLSGAQLVAEAEFTLSNIALVSADVDGGQGSGGSVATSISADGRYVVFQSSSNDLLAADNNNASDIFLKDTWTGTLTPVSTASDGTQGNLGSTSASISADGRYVVFSSNASQLVPGDTNRAHDVFLKDTQTGTPSREYQPPAMGVRET